MGMKVILNDTGYQGTRIPKNIVRDVFFNTRWTTFRTTVYIGNKEIPGGTHETYSRNLDHVGTEITHYKMDIKKYIIDVYNKTNKSNVKDHDSIVLHSNSPVLIELLVLYDDSVDMGDNEALKKIMRHMNEFATYKGDMYYIFKTIHVHWHGKEIMKKFIKFLVSAKHENRIASLCTEFPSANDSSSFAIFSVLLETACEMGSEYAAKYIDIVRHTHNFSNAFIADYIDNQRNWLSTDAPSELSLLLL